MPKFLSSFAYRATAHLAGVSAAAALAGCSHPVSPAPLAAAPQVTVLSVHRTSMPHVAELPGRTTPTLVAEVRARVDGIVQQRLFTEGANVHAGEPLYHIDPAQYEAQLNSALAAQRKAEASLAAVRLQAQRYQELLAANAVSRQATDNAVASAEQAAADVGAAKAAVALARLNLAYTKVAAPIGGRTSTSLVTQGAYVQANQATLLTTIQQLDPIYVDLTQAESALDTHGNTSPGPARVTLTLNDGSAYPLPGKLAFTGTSVDPGTGTVKLRAVFPNPKGALLPGMYVHAHVEQGTDDGILVPAQAVAHDASGKPTALVVDANDKVELRVLQASVLHDGQWLVTGGLRDGENVVVAGLQKALPGTVVVAVPAATH
jgi:membrane fusion protein (multidrug efflux system)